MKIFPKNCCQERYLAAFSNGLRRKNDYFSISHGPSHVEDAAMINQTAAVCNQKHSQFHSLTLVTHVCLVRRFTKAFGSLVLRHNKRLFDFNGVLYLIEFTTKVFACTIPAKFSTKSFRSSAVAFDSASSIGAKRPLIFAARFLYLCATLLGNSS